MPDNTKTVTIKILLKEEEAKKKTEEVKKSLTGLGVEVKKTAKKAGEASVQMTKGIKDTSKSFAYHLTFIAWHFRYLGNIFSRWSRQWERIAGNAVNTASELQESFLSIRTAGALFGQSADEAIGFTKKLALTGLVPLTDAANEVKNLMVSGLGVPEMERFSKRYLDYAFLMTSGGDEMAKSFKTITERVLRGGSALIKDVAASRIWTETNNRLNRTLGVSLKDLSAKQRALEVLKTIEKDYAGTVGFHRMEENTLRAALTRLKTSVTLLSDAYGRTLAPAVLVLSDMVGKLTSKFLNIVPHINKSILLFSVLGATILTTTSSFSFLIGVFISFFNIIRTSLPLLGGLSLSLGQFSLLFAGISAALTLGTYLVLKHTGAWDKMKTSLGSIEKQIAKVKSKFQDIHGVQEEGVGITLKEKLAHKRKVADIMEDLEREKAKGLWANQMTIKDLEKRLKRENEDWALTQKKKGEAGKKFQNIFAKQLDEIGKSTDELNEKLGETKNKITDLGNIARITFKKVFDLWNKLPVIAQGLFAGLLTYLSLTWVPGVLKSVLGAIVKILLRWKNLVLTISTPIGISILVGEAIMAIERIRAAIKGFEKDIEGVSRADERATSLAIEWLKKSKEKWGVQSEQYQKAKKQLQDLMRLEEEHKRMLPTTWRKWGEYMWKGAVEWFKKNVAPLETPFNLRRHQTGGIVPGLRNEPVPIIAHGGERVIPAGEVGTGGNITVNFNNPVIREQEDLNRIAQAVSQVLGQRARWGRMGSF